MPDALRLLWITENYPPRRGGMAESCDRIVYHLRQAGHWVDLFYLSERSPGLKCRTVQGGRDWTFPVGADAAHSLNLLWLELKQQEESAQWQVLVAFGGFLPVLAAPILHHWLHLPLLTLLRGNDFDTAIFSPRRREPLWHCLEASSAIGVVSQDKKQKIEALFPQKPVFYTPNGLDTEDWEASPGDQAKASAWRKENVLPGQRLIGIFGHLKEKKGVRFFLEAAGQTGRLAELDFLFVGDLEEDIHDFLSTHADHIAHTLHPFTDRFSLLPVYLACDAVAVPSFYDGMPNVLLEAGALGRPFLAAQVAGLADVLVNEAHGFLFPPNNIQAARQALLDFLDCPLPLWQAKGQTLQAHIREHYTAVRECTHLQNILATLYPGP
ncbi:MAG: hypothetical protein OHK0053_20930 [Microscillaceae bacterium]